jgi:hypothetical protein
LALLVHQAVVLVVQAAAEAAARTAVAHKAALVVVAVYLFTTRIEREKCLNLLY